MLVSYSQVLPVQPTLWAVDWPTLRFVLRRHRASRLHWDLRIEANGILYSWFLLRPPSVDPVKPVWAGLQAPHDPRYMLSERRIPFGQPGAGPTLVEEFGWLMPTACHSDSHSERLHDEFLSGRMDLWIEGKLLRGGFRLEGQNHEWQLRKLSDEFASIIQPEWTGRSALSGQTLDDL